MALCTRDDLLWPRGMITHNHLARDIPLVGQCFTLGFWPLKPKSRECDIAVRMSLKTYGSCRESELGRNSVQTLICVLVDIGCANTISHVRVGSCVDASSAVG